MCIMCIITASGKKAVHSKRDARILEAAKVMNQEVAIGLLGPENSRELKSGYAKLLHETASMIEAAIKDEDAINEVTREHMTPLEDAVKRELEKAEGEFYTQYGVTMPDQVRAVVTGRAFEKVQSAANAASSRAVQCAVRHHDSPALCIRQPGHNGSHVSRLGGETIVWN